MPLRFPTRFPATLLCLALVFGCEAQRSEPAPKPDLVKKQSVPEMAPVDAPSSPDSFEARAKTVEVRIDEVTGGDGVTTLTGSVTNRGKARLEMVELALDFLAPTSGESIAQISYVPFEHEGLDAGESREFRYVTPSAPMGWKDGEVVARVIDLE